jgi:hypothetical protein
MGEDKELQMTNVFAGQSVSFFASMGALRDIREFDVYEADENLGDMEDLLRCAKRKPIFKGDPKVLLNDPNRLFIRFETMRVVWIFVSRKAGIAFLGAKKAQE